MILSTGSKANSDFCSPGLMDGGGPEAVITLPLATFSLLALLQRPDRERFRKSYKPNSVCPGFGPGERIICLSSQYPELIPQCGTGSGQLRSPLFGLAPDGVFRASALALGAVGSYSTFSPLPRQRQTLGLERRGGLFSVALSVGMPLGIASRVYPSRWFLRQDEGLRGIAPFGVRTFLPRLAPEAILRPSEIEQNILELRPGSKPDLDSDGAK
jgi:hypothetical protein